MDMVSRVVTPRETLAGTALGSSQKLTWQLDVFLQMSKPFSEWRRSVYPGDYDKHTAGHIDSKKVVREFSLEG